MLTASWEPSQIVPDLSAFPYPMTSICSSFRDLVRMLAFFTLCQGPDGASLGT